MNRSPIFYTASHGLIWSPGSENVRTVTEAQSSLAHLAAMVTEAPTEALFDSYLVQFADLCRAIREAKQQEADSPIQEIAA